MKYIFPIIFLLSSAVGINVSAQKIGTAKHKQSKPEITENGFRSPFRYIIVRGVSKLEEYVNENPDNLSLEVLIENRGFTERNLILLFQLLSKRFTEKPGLTVEVYTSLDAIRTPEENEAINLKGPIDNYKQYKYAFYNRNGYGEYFTYGIPGKVRNKEIVLTTPTNSNYRDGKRRRSDGVGHRGSGI